MRNIKAILFTFLLILFWVSPLSAQEEAQSLRQEVQALKERIAQLEKEQAPTADPLTEIERMQREMNRMMENSFDRMGGANSGILNAEMSYDPHLDLEETANGYTIRVDTAGYDPNQIDVDVKGDTLTVSGKTKQSAQETTPEGQRQYQSYGTFARSISLPQDANAAQIQTRTQGDTLIIQFPKKQAI